MIRYCVLLSLGLIVLAGSPAMSWASTGHSLCPELLQPETYAEPDNEDYAMMIAGKDGRLYRSRLDLKFRFRLTDNTKDSFHRLNEAFRSKGTQLVIAMMPTRGIVDHEHLVPPFSERFNQVIANRNFLKMLDELRGTGVQVADMSGVEDVDDYFLPDDNHWTASGAKFTAAAVAQTIKGLPVYKELDRSTEFTTRTKAVPAFKPPSRYLDFINSICRTSLAPAPLREQHETAPKLLNVNADALFADKPLPQIVLIGTSNSTDPEPSYANFAGFLKEYLQADVLNESISGGSLQGSITNFLVSGRYEKTRPKVVVWEMSAHYGFNRQSFLREIVPAVYGECSEADQLAGFSGPLSARDTTIFSDLKKKQISGKSHYLALRIDDETLRSVKIRFLHADGRTNTVKLERPLRSFSSHSGLFFAELSDELKAHLDEVRISVEKPNLKATARICKAPVSEEMPSVTHAESVQSDDETGLEDTDVRSFKSWFKGPMEYWASFFSGYSVDITPATIGAKPASSPILPDITGYTLEAVRKQIPLLQAGIVEFDNMEGSPVLRKFAFNKRLVEFQSIQDRVEPQAIHILEGKYDFATLRRALAGKDVISERPEGYLLRFPIAVYPGATLILKDLDKPLLLSQQNGAFIASAGDLFIVNSKLFGWNEKTGQPASLDKKFSNFRPFIATWDGSRSYFAASEFKHMGYNASKSYGLTISTNNVVQEEYQEAYGDLLPPTGWLVGNHFEDFYFGFYSYEAENVAIIGNRYENNIIYGIDPHDRSRNLIIARNKVRGTKKKHGIIISRQVNDSYIFENDVRENVGTGIMLDRGCVNTVVANNTVVFNKGDGITVYESPRNLIYGNKIEQNAGAGVRIRNSWDVVVQKGTIFGNQQHAFIVYEDPLEGTRRDPAIDPVIPRSEASFIQVKAESNGRGLLKTNGLHQIRFQWMETQALDKYFSGDIQSKASNIARGLERGRTITIQSRTKAGEKEKPPQLIEYEETPRY